MGPSVPVECSNLLASCALHLKCFAEVSQHEEDVNLEGVPACTFTVRQLLRGGNCSNSLYYKAGTEQNVTTHVGVTVSSLRGGAFLLFPKLNPSVHQACRVQLLGKTPQNPRDGFTNLRLTPPTFPPVFLNISNFFLGETSCCRRDTNPWREL